MRARRGIALATAGLTAALALTGCTTGAADEEGKLTVYIGRDEDGLIHAHEIRRVIPRPHPRGATPQPQRDGVPRETLRLEEVR